MGLRHLPVDLGVEKSGRTESEPILAGEAPVHHHLPRSLQKYWISVLCWLGDRWLLLPHSWPSIHSDPLVPSSLSCLGAEPAVGTASRMKRRFLFWDEANTRVVSPKDPTALFQNATARYAQHIKLDYVTITIVITNMKRKRPSKPASEAAGEFPVRAHTGVFPWVGLLPEASRTSLSCS